MIRMNLIPLTRQRQKGTKAYRFIPMAIVVLCAGTLCLGLASAFLLYEITQQEQYYAKELYPVQQRLEQRNDRIERAKLKADRIRAGLTSRIAWPALLVCLADTKPPDVAVQGLTADKDKLCLHLTSTKIASVQTWLRQLKKTEYFSQVHIGNVQKKEKARLEMQLYLGFGNADETNGKTETASIHKK